MSDSQLRWQCRRGMRELDELLGAYVDGCYGKSSDAEKAWFRDFLTLPDPELARYLLKGEEIADGVAASVIRQIRSRVRANEAPS